MKPKTQTVSETTTDVELFAALAEAKVSALSHLYDRYADRLFGLAVKIIKDEVLAEDVIQDLFIYLWQNPSRFQRERGNALSWLMVLCRNRCIDKVRAKSRSLSRNTAINETVLQIPSDGAAGDPLEVVEQKEVQSKITQALETLPTEQREPIELAYFSGFSQTEIADKLKVPLGTVKTRVRLGMQKLRSLMN